MPAPQGPFDTRNCNHESQQPGIAVGWECDRVPSCDQPGAAGGHNFAGMPQVIGCLASGHTEKSMNAKTSIESGRPPAHGKPANPDRSWRKPASSEVTRSNAPTLQCSRTSLSLVFQSSLNEALTRLTPLCYCNGRTFGTRSLLGSVTPQTLKRPVQSHDHAQAASVRASSPGDVYLLFQLSLTSARATVTYVRSATSRRPDLAFTPARNQC
jgi:hypothetical protein